MATIDTIKAGIWYGLKIEVKAGQISAYWNNNLVVTWTDTSPWTSGKVGFRKGNGQGVNWDNFYVWSDGNGSVLSYNDSYPFGLTMPNRSSSYSPVDGRYRFTGKELDAAETGLFYFGKRYYDPFTARWPQVDPLTDNYPGWSPYNYCANNPILFYDMHGDSLSVTSQSNNDLQSFLDYLSQGLGGFYELQQDENGNYLLESTNKQGKMNQQQFSLYFLLKFVISNRTKLKLNLGNSAFSMIGDYKTGKISMSDIEVLAKSNQKYLTVAGALGHEIFEQAIKQFCGLSDSNEDIEIAHSFGMIMEDQINGSTRGMQLATLGNDVTINFLKGTSDFGRVHFFFDRYGNLQKVEQKTMEGKWDLSNFKNGR